MRWRTGLDPAVWRVINVPAATHTKILRIRALLGLRTMGQVVDVLTRRLA